MSTNEEQNGKESKEPDYDEDENQLEERQKRKQENLTSKKQRIKFFEQYGLLPFLLFSMSWTEERYYSI